MLDTRNRIDAIALIALLLAAPGARADQWQFNPRIEVGGTTDSNYLLLPGDAVKSVSGGFGNVLLELRDASDATDFRFAPGVYATYFPNSTAEQSTDPYAYLFLAHRGQTSTATLLADYHDQSTVFSDRLTSNQGAGGLGNPNGGDSGYVELRNRRQTAHVLPSFSIEVSPLNRVTAELNYYDVAYQKFIPNTYVGFRSAAGAVGWQHDLSQRTSWTVRAVYSHFQPDGATGSSNSTGFAGEWNNRVSEKSQAYVRVGAVRTRFGQVAAGQSDHTISYSGGAGMNWAFQVTQVFLDLTRTIDPNSSGYAIGRDQVVGRVARDLTPLLVGYVGARALKDKAQQGGTLFVGRTYAVGTAGFEWRLMRAWTLVGEYNYAHQKYEINPVAAKSNVVNLSFVYEPHRELSKLRAFGRDRGY